MNEATEKATLQITKYLHSRSKYKGKRKKNIMFYIKWNLVQVKCSGKSVVLLKRIVLCQIKNHERKHFEWDVRSRIWPAFVLHHGWKWKKKCWFSKQSGGGGGGRTATDGWKSNVIPSSSSMGKCLLGGKVYGPSKHRTVIPVRASQLTLSSNPNPVPLPPFLLRFTSGRSHFADHKYSSDGSAQIVS